MNKRDLPSIGSINFQRPSLAAPSNTGSTLSILPCSPEHATKVTEVIDEAFRNDPTWSWAFPDAAARRLWWTHCITNALRYPTAFATSGFETVAVWIPPSGLEFSNEGEQKIPGLLKDLVGSRASDVAELLNRFDHAHPRTEPHYYLSLLGTQNGHRGCGLGMALLKENLMRIDGEHMPAYLESSNPANNHRYESAGFVKVVSFEAPGNGPVVTGMWRKARQ
jgi:hypothetical protein